MNKVYTFLLFYIFSLFCFSQNETSNWYFGDKSGFYFNKGKIDILNNSKMSTPAGCSTISDVDGNLLFYTDGQTVWNKNHAVMQNGSNLGGNKELFQNSIIIPKPNSKNIYYLLYLKNTLPATSHAFYLAEIEVSQNFPQGIVKRKNELISSFSTERITAVHSKDGKSIWVITINKGSSSDSLVNTISVFKFNENGIQRPPINYSIQETISTLGAMKISPDGSKLAVADYNGSNIFLYDFDTITGNITFSERVFTDVALFSPTYPLSVEFSSDSKILYYSARQRLDSSILVQYILNSPFPADPLYSKKQLIYVSYDSSLGTLQLANNGKIYASIFIKTDPADNVNNLIYTEDIGVINEPNKHKFESNYNHSFVKTTPGLSLKGLPNFISSYLRNRIITENKCAFELFDFSLDAYAPITSVIWDFGDNSNTSTNINPTHAYTSSGNYIVTATVTINNQQQNIYKRIKVFPLPELIKNQKLVQCDDDNDGISLFNLNNISSKISKDTSLNYTFYKSLTDAQNNSNPILDPENFYNESNPQTIYTKAISINECTEIESFTIESLFKPSINISPIIECEIPDSNNEANFDLQRKRVEIDILLNLSKSYKISFFPTFKDAQKYTNELPDLYKSSSTIIWVKIENENGCSGISPIQLTVNTLPITGINDSFTICVNPTSHAPVIITANNNNDKFEWKDENGNIISLNNNFTLTKTGKYSLTVYKTQNNIECSNTSDFIVINPTPPVIVSLDFNSESEQKNSVYVTVNGNSSYEFSLNNIDYFGNGTSHTFYDVTPGINTVYVRDINKCEAITTDDVSIIGYPKFLSPNGDNKNDTWTVYGVNSNFFKKIDITIFNRFGRVLYTINNQNAEQGWNGTLNGKNLPPNDYWFYAKLVDLNDNVIEKKGHFSLQKL